MLAPISEFFSGSASFFVLIAAVLYFVYSVRSWYRLRHFDGPWLAKHSYLWLLVAVTSNKIHLKFPEMHKKYGSIVRIGPNDLVTNDIKLLQHMSAARSAYSRSNWYNTQEVDTRAPSVFSDTNKKSHDLFKSYMALGGSIPEKMSRPWRAILMQLYAPSSKSFGETISLPTRRQRL